MFLTQIIFLYQKSLKRTFKLVFEYKITFWICVLVLWIHKGYCVVKKLMWNLRIKAFWYTKIIIWEEIFDFFICSFFKKILFQYSSKLYFICTYCSTFSIYIIPFPEIDVCNKNTIIKIYISPNWKKPVAV